MPKFKKRTWAEHIELLEFLVNHTVKEAATHFQKLGNIKTDSKNPEASIRTWLYTLRKNLAGEQAAINKIRTLQRISTRVRKFTTIGSLEQTGEDEEN